MTRLLGIFLMVLLLYCILMGSFPHARSVQNHEVLSQRLGYYGVLTIGVGVLIVAGGIDLSLGSLVALGAVCCGQMMRQHVPPLVAMLAVVAGAGVIGLAHGLLVTQLRLQPFLVTLCGLFMYRGLARRVAGEASVSVTEVPGLESLRWTMVSGNILGISNQLLLLLVLAGLLAVFLHRTVYGRYLFAIGYNKQAARYAGIATGRYQILAYVICSTLAGLASVLYLLEHRGAQPTSAGQLLELYAITGAVLGGCSLRGGEGTIPGMLLGAAVLPMLYQLCNFSPYIGSDLEWTVIGGALLLGTIGNELVARRSATRTV
jgi:ribose transport system permease protein